jgi:hypothetical protein
VAGENKKTRILPDHWQEQNRRRELVDNRIIFGKMNKQTSKERGKKVPFLFGVRRKV